MKFQLSKPILLREHLESCLKNDQTGEWMIFKEDITQYSMSMELYSVHLENWDLEQKNMKKSKMRFYQKATVIFFTQIN